MDMPRVCLVCGDRRDVAKYFGAITCDACRAFFKLRSEKQAPTLQETPPCGGQCPLTREDRRCKHCRMAKCISLGMSLDKSAKASKEAKSSSKDKAPVKKSKLSLKGSKKTAGSLSDWATKDTETTVATETTEATNEEPEEIEDEKTPCVAALHNLGNSCYLSSVVQILRYTPKFEEKVANLAKEIKKTERERSQLAQLKQTLGPAGSHLEEDEEILTWELVRNLHSVFRKMALAEEKYMTGQSNFIAIRPYDLLDTVERLNPMFQGNLQQDAHEFLRCLLAYVQDASRELNKYRTRSAQTQCAGPQGDAPPVAPPPLPLYSQPREVEVLGGCKDESKVKESASKTTKTRTSQRLSGGKVTDENGAVTNSLEMNGGVKMNVNGAKLSGAKGVSRAGLEEDEIIKNGGKKRRSLTELQNQDFITVQGGPVTILGSLVTNGDAMTTAHGDPDKLCNGVTDDQESRKRKAETMAPGGETLVCEVYSDTPAGCDGCNDVDESLMNDSKRQKRSLSESEPAQIDHIFDMECENIEDDNDENQMNNSDPVIIAKVQPREMHGERKQTARKTMGGPKGDVGSPDDASTESTDTTTESSSSADSEHKAEAKSRQAVVKLDKNGINKYFAKVSRPRRLSEIERHTEETRDPIDDLFQGQVALQTRCCECETVTERREAYQDISVAVRRTEDDDDDSNTATETEEKTDPYSWVRQSLSEVERLKDDNKYVCDQCCHLVEAERSTHYTSVPDVLTLHLKRFAMLQGLGGGFTKLTDHVPLPLVLPCIEDDCTDSDKHRLRLYGVVTHTGFTLSCGHYTAYVRAHPLNPALLDLGMDRAGDSATSAITATNESATTAKEPATTETEPGTAMTGQDDADPNNNQDDNNNVDQAPGAAGDAATSVTTATPPDMTSVTPSATSVTPSVTPSYWFECDDNVISIFTEEEFIKRVAPGHSNTNTPYLLFYQRVHDDTAS